MSRNRIHCVTINETRFEKREDTIKAVVRTSQIGDEFAVYVEVYSRPRDLSLIRKSCDSIEAAVLSAREYTTILIEEGFKITAIN